MTTELDSFPRFSRLPVELQHRIWHFSFPPAQIIDVYAIPVKSQLKRQDSTSTTSVISDNTRYTRIYTERLYTHPQPFMQVLHACHLSRRLATKHYFQIAAELYVQPEMDRESVFLPPLVHNENFEIVFERSTVRGLSGQAPFVIKPYALLNPKRDILFLQDPSEINEATSRYITSSLDILVRWLKPSIASTLRRLAVTYYTWHKTKKQNGNLNILKQFGALEHVFVSWLGRAPVRSWSDVLTGGPGAEVDGGGHFEEIRNEIKCDVEVLRRTEREWRAPIVEVIMHRGLLSEKLG